MSAITWSENLPAQSSLASMTDDFLRSMMTSLAAGLGESLYWPGSAASAGASAASAGEPRPGSLRFARSSLRTGGYPLGTLHSDESRMALNHVGSAHTGTVGHAAMLDRNGGIGDAPFTAVWLIQTGSYTTPGRSSAPRNVQFASAFSGQPTVLAVSSSESVLVSVSGINASGFSSRISFIGESDSSAANVTVTWYSEGTVAL